MRTSRENKEYLENAGEITKYRKYVYPVYPVVCPREDQADMTHAISPICLKLSQIIKVIELFKSPK